MVNKKIYLAFFILLLSCNHAKSNLTKYKIRIDSVSFNKFIMWTTYEDHKIYFYITITNLSKSDLYIDNELKVYLLRDKNYEKLTPKISRSKIAPKQSKLIKLVYYDQKYYNTLEDFINNYKKNNFIIKFDDFQGEKIIIKSDSIKVSYFLDLEKVHKDDTIKMKLGVSPSSLHLIP